MSRTFYWQLYQMLQQEAVVVATVTRTRGSTPREVGAKMIITQTGHTIDTIGGGAGEAKVCQQARSVLATGEKQWVEIDLSGNLSSVSQRPVEGVCGGWMQVWLERWSGEAAIDLTRQILHHLHVGQPGLLVTPLVNTRSPYLVLQWPDDMTAPEIQMLAEAEGSQIPALLEPLPLVPTLLIVGAGHVAVPLAKMAHLLGFQLIVQDDRPAFACADRFPPETVIWSQPIDSIAEQPHFSQPQASELYVALVTRGYQHDLDALRQLLQHSFPRYVGMIGSKKRVQLVIQALQQHNIPSAWLSQIRAPIGLDIGALTPEEIAVSICAELIQVRRGGTGQPLSLGLNQSHRSKQAMQPIPQPVQFAASNHAQSPSQHILQQIIQQQS